MDTNIFTEFQDKKQRLIKLTEKACESNWIDKERKEQIVDKINNDVLTIGVIGQMKCGKSTFLNAFVFEDDVLPSATTPMTAALSVITYGAEKKLVAEFYTQQEWEEQKRQAQRSLDSVRGNALEESKIKAAQELVKLSEKLGSSLSSYLGGSKEDTLDNLERYVGAEGDYVGITKYVTIYYPKEYLKGVEIVDTPGFNDPIVSREERTKEFLKKADVVLLLLYAGRPFDSTDKEILFKNVKQCGTGKVLIGINKYDIPYAQGEGEEEIIQYVTEEIKKAGREYRDDTLNMILSETRPIALSAGMALNSVMSMSKVNGNDNYKLMWDRACDDFEISSQKEMRDKSHIDLLITAIKKMLNEEKIKILFRKPVNAIQSAGNEKLEKIKLEIKQDEAHLQDLNKPDDELEEKKSKLERAEKRLNRKIDGLETDFEEAFIEIIRQGKMEMEDDVDAACRRMVSFLDEVGRLSSFDKVIPRIQSECDVLATRTLKRRYQGLQDNAKVKIKNTISDFLADAGDVISKYIDDFDDRDFLKMVEKKIMFDSNDDVFKPEDWGSYNDESFGDYVWAFISGATFGLANLAGNFLSHNETKANIEGAINQIKAEFNPEPFLNGILTSKDKIISNVKECFFDNLLNPMKEQLDDILSKKADKEQDIKKTQEKLETLKKQRDVMIEQKKEIDELSKQIEYAA